MRMLAAALVAATVWSCASGAPGSGASPDLPISVQVTNHNWLDVHAYVVVGGQRHSLGLITTTNTLTFQLRRHVGGSRGVVFLALPIGSNLAFVSEELLVEPGDQVVWTIHNNLRQSTVSIH
ncbi:MAG: hypothetical protein ACRELC_01265 [Gemmatimonadota bacterium]